MQYNDKNRYLVAGWAFLETLLFGGLIYGWTPVVFMFKRRNVYADLCPDPQGNFTDGATIYDNTTSSSVQIVLLNSTDRPLSNVPLAQTTCRPQDEKFTLAFTIGSAMFCASSALFGQINFKFGTRITRIISMIIFVSGTIMFAFVSVENPWLIFPALTAVGVGGLPLLMTNAQVSNLFPSGASTFIGLLCGAYDSSSVIQLLVKIMDQHCIKYKYTYLVITGLHAIVLVSTFVFLPKTIIARKEESTKNPEVPEDDKAVKLLEKHENNDHSVYETTTLDEKSEARRMPSLKECIMSSEYLFHVYWLCLIQLRFYYFLGTSNPYINRLTDNDPNQVSYYTDVMVYTMFGGFISSSLSGVVYDVSRNMFKDSPSELRRRLMPCVMPLFVATAFSIGMSILVLIPSPRAMYGAFIFMTLTRSFLYGIGTAYISATFPTEYFGVLYGIMILTGGVIAFLQFALFTWSQASPSSPMHADLFCLCLTVAALVHPVAQWIKCKRSDYTIS